MRDTDFPGAKLVARHLPGVAIPAVEVADELCVGGAWSPLAVDDGIALDDKAHLGVTLQQRVRLLTTSQSRVCTLANSSREPSAASMASLVCWYCCQR